MDVKVKCYEDEDYGESSVQTMSINSKHELTVGNLCDCPEDAIIGRDLVDCCQVCRFMTLAYEAGKNGEPLNVEITKCENRDDVV